MHSQPQAALSSTAVSPAEDHSGDFVLDAPEAARRKAERVRRFETVEAPALRFAGYCILTLLLPIYDHFLTPGFDRATYLWKAGLMIGYSLAAWGLVRALYGRLKRFDLSLFLLHTDILVYLITLHNQGGRLMLLFGVLLSRVADQTQISFRRAFYFTNLTSGGFLLYLVLRHELTALEIDWKQSFAAAATLWLIGTYISLTARTGARLAGRTRQAVRTARELLHQLEEKSAQLVRARSQAEAANAAKSEFVAHVSHELRTPMGAVLGLTDLLLDEEGDPDRQRHLKLIHNSANALLALLNDLLDNAKMEAAKLDLLPQPTRPGDLVEEVLQLEALRAAERGVELIGSVSPRVPALVEMDGGRVRQIVMNLVGNALKFTSEGAVTVDLDAAPLDEGRAELQLVVRDTGIGIPPEKQGAVFGAFEQADSSISQNYGGTGLGLAITAKLVALMGGQISLESEVGRGSAFRITVPVPILADPAGEAESFRVVGRRALVVAAHEATRSRLQAALLDLGIETEGLAAAGEALERLREEMGGGAIDLVLLEALPHDDGSATASAIKRLGPAAPGVILLTPAGAPLDPASSRRPGVVASLRKPARRAELIEAVRAALRLRAVPALADLPAPAPNASAESAPELQILLVEDNEINRLVAIRLLQKLGHQVTSVSDGALAVEHCRERRWDAVFMDIEMPGMNGFEATAALRGLPSTAGQWIIAMTAHASREDQARCLAQGMDDYVSKPIGRTALADALARVGSRTTAVLSA